MAALRNVQQCPPNYVSFSLNGSAHQVLQDFTFCRKEFLDWSFQMATHKIEFGNGRNVYTTPSSSTFYYGMNYGERYMVFVIEARNGRLCGYYGINGIYEFKSITQVEPYMNDPSCRRLKFEGNHPEIYGSIGKTGIGLDALRDAFDAIWEYDGDTEPSNFMKAFGVIDVHISESMKIQPVFYRICEAFTNPSVTKLGIEDNDFIERLITGWNYLSGQAMRAVDAKRDNRNYQISARGIMNISSVEDILKYLTVLHVDGFNLGIFAHDDAPNPRVWEPLKQGTDVEGVDDDIPNLEDPTYDDEGGGDRGYQKEESAGKHKMGGGGKRKLHQEGNGKGGAGGEVEGRGRGVCLSAADFPNHLISGWGGDGTEFSMDQDSVQCAREHQDLECMGMTGMSKPYDMSIMVESKDPLIQAIKSCSLTSLPFYTPNLQPRDRGAIGMTLGEDRLVRTEACKRIGTALPLGLEGEADPLLMSARWKYKSTVEWTALK